jgi:hypothetical protein
MTVFATKKATAEALRNAQPMHANTVTTPAAYAVQRAEYAAYVLSWEERHTTDALAKALAAHVARVNEDALDAFNWSDNLLRAAAARKMWVATKNDATSELERAGAHGASDEMLLRTMFSVCMRALCSEAGQVLQSGMRAVTENAKLNALANLHRELKSAVRYFDAHTF